MRTLGLEGVRRVRKIRTTIPGPDGKRAGDLLNRDFTAPAPDRVWVTDFTYARTWAGFVYVAFVLDVFAQRIVGWHASSSMRTDLVMTPLRIALWQRDREGNPGSPGDLIHHSDAGAQAVFNRSFATAAPSTESSFSEKASAGVGHPRISRGLLLIACATATIFSLTPTRQVGALGEVLADEPVEVLIATALPRTLRVSEVDGQTDLLREEFVSGEFLPSVPGQRPSE